MSGEDRHVLIMVYLLYEVMKDVRAINICVFRQATDSLQKANKNNF